MNLVRLLIIVAYSLGLVMGNTIINQYNYITVVGEGDKPGAILKQKAKNMQSGFVKNKYQQNRVDQDPTAVVMSVPPKKTRAGQEKAASSTYSFLELIICLIIAIILFVVIIFVKSRRSRKASKLTLADHDLHTNTCKTNFGRSQSVFEAYNYAYQSNFTQNSDSITSQEDCYRQNFFEHFTMFGNMLVPDKDERLTPSKKARQNPNNRGNFLCIFPKQIKMEGP